MTGISPHPRHFYAEDLGRKGKDMKNTVKLMKLSIAFVAISSLSLIGVAFADFNGSGFPRFIAYFTGAAFWSFLIAGYVLLAVVSNRRKADKRTKVTDKRPGILCFFTSKEAKIADIGMFAAILFVLVFSFIPGISVAVRIIFIALLVLSVQMHCILNGVNYRYIRLLTEGKTSKKESIV